ncbi:hypothetical protein I4U23_018553 [Adineta vaga]|nr:hypothetical protein I4U23_018553 [Adineta vaga]
MNERYKYSWYRLYLSLFVHELIDGLDQLLEFIYNYIEVPIENFSSYFINFSLWYYRRPVWFNLSKIFTQILVQSYVITFVFYFICLFLAQFYSHAIQKYYFLDPILSKNRQCIDIQFVHINNHHESLGNNTLLNENFLHENFIIGQESRQIKHDNYTQLHELFDILQDNFFIICQRSLYLYTRFQSYSSLLHSNHSYYRFFISKYSSTFAIDQPPFIDLCVHTSNQTHLEQLQSRLHARATTYYSSVNLFLFDFNFTQVSITLYQLNKNSTHLERVSIHSGWLRNVYSQLYSFKYDHALSTVLFDGLSVTQSFVDYYQYFHIPVPADPLLGLNEMVQESILVLPLCEFPRRNVLAN